MIVLNRRWVTNLVPGIEREWSARLVLTYASVDAFLEAGPNPYELVYGPVHLATISYAWEAGKSQPRHAQFPERTEAKPVPLTGIPFK